MCKVKHDIYLYLTILTLCLLNNECNPDLFQFIFLYILFRFSTVSLLCLEFCFVLCLSFVSVLVLFINFFFFTLYQKSKLCGTKWFDSLNNKYKKKKIEIQNHKKKWYSSGQFIDLFVIICVRMGKTVLKSCCLKPNERYEK